MTLLNSCHSSRKTGKGGKQQERGSLFCQVPQTQPRDERSWACRGAGGGAAGGADTGASVFRQVSERLAEVTQEESRTVRGLKVQRDWTGPWQPAFCCSTLDREALRCSM